MKKLNWDVLHRLEARIETEMVQSQPNSLRRSRLYEELIELGKLMRLMKTKQDV